MKILAAIITFNRLELLKRCYEHLKIQSHKVDQILVINNSSTDQTESYLNNNNIKYITQDNNGSASGWFACIEYAKNNNFDYIWLMDDDGYPEKNALKYLIDVFKEKINAVCLSSVVIDEKNHNNFIFPYPLLSNKDLPVILALKRKYYKLNNLLKKNKKNIFYPYAQLFNGALIKTKVFNKIGNVNKDYYIFGEEVDLFWRLKDHGEVGSILKSFHFHPNVNKRKYTNEKVYYYLKNSIINNYKHLNRPFLRSILSIIILLLRVTKRNGLNSTIKYLVGSKKKIFYLSIKNGFKKKLRIDHNEIY